MAKKSKFDQSSGITGAIVALAAAWFFGFLQLGAAPAPDKT